MSAPGTSTMGGDDPYAPANASYWDGATNRWEFDYESFYKAQGAAASSAAARTNVTVTNNDLHRQELQATVYDYDARRAKRDANFQGPGHLNKGETRETVLRRAAGKLWEDPTLLEWDPSHKRLFVGDLGNDVYDELLARAFSKYPSFSKARVVRKKPDGKSKGYGFVAFADPEDFLQAWKEMDGKYIGSRPCRLKKANEDVSHVKIGARKDRLLAANAKYDAFLAKAKMGGTIGSKLRRNGGVGKPYAKK
ncbi:hypothetical protein MSPP1_003340 [Malassezia sp. CBS 17886]|nr:hypothetical protein MSPP1_003340 [Malassezia sp. CBS 17886]